MSTNDPNLPNHYYQDSLGDPYTCTENHNHPDPEDIPGIHSPGSMALEALRLAAIDANRADPNNPKGAGARFVSALHFAYMSGVSWADIATASEAGR